MPLQKQIKRDAWGSQLPATTIPSGQKGPGSYTVVTGPGVFFGFIATTNGTDDVTVDFYDKLSAGANDDKLIPTFIIEGADRFGGAIPPPVGFDTGMYMIVAGTGAKVVAYYME